LDDAAGVFLPEALSAVFLPEISAVADKLALTEELPEESFPAVILFAISPFAAAFSFKEDVLPEEAISPPAAEAPEFLPEALSAVFLPEISAVADKLALTEELPEESFPAVILFAISPFAAAFSFKEDVLPEEAISPPAAEAPEFLPPAFEPIVSPFPVPEFSLLFAVFAESG
jgi:hypothetical protein